jgi:hypothetical protein
MVRIESVKRPFDTPVLAVKGARALARADAMGLLPDKGQRWTLRPSTFAQLAPRLRRIGVGCDVAFFLGRLAFSEEPALVERCLDRLAEALETSPVPDDPGPQRVRQLAYGLTGSPAMYRQAPPGLPFLWEAPDQPAGRGPRSDLIGWRVADAGRPAPDLLPRVRPLEP